MSVQSIPPSSVPIVLPVRLEYTEVFPSLRMLLDACGHTSRVTFTLRDGHDAHQLRSLSSIYVPRPKVWVSSDPLSAVASPSTSARSLHYAIRDIGSYVFTYGNLVYVSPLVLYSAKVYANLARVHCLSFIPVCITLQSGMLDTVASRLRRFKVCLQLLYVSIGRCSASPLRFFFASFNQFCI